jgi:CMP/dCMP kinase
MATSAVITVDGPSGAGKSTASQELAQSLGYRYFDSGALYRVVALAVLEQGVAEDDEEALGRLCATLEVSFSNENGRPRVYCQGRDVSETIRTPEISMAASRISARKVVRDALTAFQRKLAEKTPLVLEGRDAGTVVFPEAPVKFFLDATPAERGRRRFRELQEKGLHITLEQVTEDIITRDLNDRTRSHAPLVPAPDAVVIDSSAMTLTQVVARMIEIIRKI